MALPGVNVFPRPTEAEISSVFFMTICVGNQTLGDTRILEREGKYIVNMQTENETNTTGTRLRRKARNISGKCRIN